MSESRWPVIWCLLLFLPVCVGQQPPDKFTLSVPDDPLSTLVGSSVTLPCSVSPAFSKTHLRWHRPDKFQKPVLHYEKQKIEEKDPQFQGRVSLIGDLKTGDMSLKLDNVTLADRGEFVCWVASPSVTEKHASLRLNVKAIGSPPVLSVSDGGSGQVRVTCVSDGWFPQPSVTWRDSEGTDISGRSNHTTTDVQGYVSVTSSVLMPPSATKWISCTVGESKESRIIPYISEINTAITDCAGPLNALSLSLLFLLLISLLVIARLVVLWRRKEKTKAAQNQNGYDEVEQGEDNRNQIQLNEGNAAEKETMDGVGLRGQEGKGAVSQKHVLVTPNFDLVKRSKEKTLTMDKSSIQGDLRVGLAERRVTCVKPVCNQPENFSHYVLCEDTFSTGQHYWEVRVYGKQSWCVGVCSDELRGQKGAPLTSQSDCWLLCLNEAEGLFVNTEPVTPVQAANTSINTIGVFLNCHGHTLAFYDVESKSCLCTFYDVSSNHPLVPVLSPGGRDDGVMVLVD